MPQAPRLVDRLVKEHRKGRRYTRDWHKIRRLVILDQPFCACGNFATAVHHIDRNRANNDRGNLVGICASCHSRLHKQEG